MALSLTTRATVTNSASADTLATGSFTPSNNSLLVVIATGLLPGGRASAPTITGGGLTWTNRLDQFRTNSWSSMCAIWTAPVTTGASMTVTVDYNATLTHADGGHGLVVLEFTGHDTTSPVRQTFNEGDTAGRSGAYSGTLGSAPLSDSYVITATANDSDAANASQLTSGSGWTQVYEPIASFYQAHFQQRTGSTSTSVAMVNYTTNGAYSWIIGGIEIAAAAGGGGDQSITGALYTDSDTFNANTVGASYGITGALYSDADTFHTATLAASYAVTGGLFSDGDSFYQASVAPGAVNIAGGLYSDPDSFHGATVTAASGDQTITGTLFSDADTFHAASVLLQQDQAITGALFANDNSFYQASIGDRTARGGDDAPRRRYPAYVPEVRAEEPVTEPEKPVQKRRVTRKAVKKALETSEIPEIFKPTVNKAQKWLPPAIEALDEAEFEAELRKLILEKALRDAEDEDDIELLLWAA